MTILDIYDISWLCFIAITAWLSPSSVRRRVMIGSPAVQNQVVKEMTMCQGMANKSERQLKTIRMTVQGQRIIFEMVFSSLEALHSSSGIAMQ